MRVARQVWRRGQVVDQDRRHAAAIPGGETRNKGRSAHERRDGAGLRPHADGRAIGQPEDVERLAGRWAQREPERHGGERRPKARVAQARDRVVEHHLGKGAEAVWRPGERPPAVLYPPPSAVVYTPAPRRGTGSPG